MSPVNAALVGGSHFGQSVFLANMTQRDYTCSKNTSCPLNWQRGARNAAVKLAKDQTPAVDAPLPEWGREAMSVIPVEECLRLSRAVKVCPRYWLRVLTHSQTVTSHYIILEQFQISFQKPDPRGNLILGKNLKINPAEGLGFFLFFSTPSLTWEYELKHRLSPNVSVV